MRSSNSSGAAGPAAQRQPDMAARMDEFAQKLNELEAAQPDMAARMDQVAHKLNELEAAQPDMAARMEEVAHKLNELNPNSNSTSSITSPLDEKRRLNVFNHNVAGLQPTATLQSQTESTSTIQGEIIQVGIPKDVGAVAAPNPKQVQQEETIENQVQKSTIANLKAAETVTDYDSLGSSDGNSGMLDLQFFLQENIYKQIMRSDAEDSKLIKFDFEPGVSQLLEVRSKIGSGGFGRIYKCRSQESVRKLALKVCVFKNRVQRDCLSKEVQFLSLLKDATYVVDLMGSQELKNVSQSAEVPSSKMASKLRMLGASETKLNRGARLMLMELAPFGCLSDYLSKSEYFTGFRDIPLVLRERLFFQMSSAVEAVHDLGILHADVKLNNYLVFPGDGCHKTGTGISFDRCNVTVKLCDFGISQQLTALDEGGDKLDGIGKSNLKKQCQDDGVGPGAVARIDPEGNDLSLDHDDQKGSSEKADAALILPRRIGTVPYMAPEVALANRAKTKCSNKVGRAIDIWSLGICFYRILYEGQFPDKHKGTTCTELLLAICDRRSKIEYPKQMDRWRKCENSNNAVIPSHLEVVEVEEDFESRCLNLLHVTRGCLDEEPIRRWTGTEVVNGVKTMDAEKTLQFLLQKRKEWEEGQRKELENKGFFGSKTLCGTTYLLDNVRIKLGTQNSDSTESTDDHSDTDNTGASETETLLTSDVSETVGALNHSNVKTDHSNYAPCTGPNDINTYTVKDDVGEPNSDPDKRDSRKSAPENKKKALSGTVLANSYAKSQSPDNDSRSAAPWSTTCISITAVLSVIGVILVIVFVCSKCVSIDFKGLGFTCIGESFKPKLGCCSSLSNLQFLGSSSPKGKSSKTDSESSNDNGSKEEAPKPEEDAPNEEPPEENPPVEHPPKESPPAEEKPVTYPILPITTSLGRPMGEFWDQWSTQKDAEGNYKFHTEKGPHEPGYWVDDEFHWKFYWYCEDYPGEVGSKWHWRAHDAKNGKEFVYDYEWEELQSDGTMKTKKKVLDLMMGDGGGSHSSIKPWTKKESLPIYGWSPGARGWHRNPRNKEGNGECDFNGYKGYDDSKMFFNDAKSKGGDGLMMYEEEWGTDCVPKSWVWNEWLRKHKYKHKGGRGEIGDDDGNYRPMNCADLIKEYREPRLERERARKLKGEGKSG